jgi:hypothetical protein
MAFVTQAQLCGMSSLVLRESGDCTLNPFDTLGLPLTSATVSRVVQDLHEARRALAGRGPEPPQGGPDRRIRPQPFRGLRRGLEERGRGALACAREAGARRRAAAAGDDDFLDGHLALLELERADPGGGRRTARGRERGRGHAPCDFPAGRRNTEAMAFSLFTAGDYPRFDGLVSLMRHGRLAHHRSAGVSAELDFLSSELAKGLRAGGVVGGVHRRPDQRRRPGRRPALRHEPPAGGRPQGAGGIRRLRPCAPAHPHAPQGRLQGDAARRAAPDPPHPGATEFVKELLAQMRKYRCVFIGAFQEPSQIDDIDPALTDLLLGQCKQYFLMRQNNADQVRRIARVIGLPGAAQRAIVQHPLVEHQSGARRRPTSPTSPGRPRRPCAAPSGSRSIPPCSTWPSPRAPSSTGG